MEMGAVCVAHEDSLWGTSGLATVRSGSTDKQRTPLPTTAPTSADLHGRRAVGGWWPRDKADLRGSDGLLTAQWGSEVTPLPQAVGVSSRWLFLRPWCARLSRYLTKVSGPLR
jgi:hypothetical protein